MNRWLNGKHVCRECVHFSLTKNVCTILCHTASCAGLHDPAMDCADFSLRSVEESESKSPEIRTFSTGATRDTSEGKLSYVKALSPIVIRRYVQYLAKHRKQPNGSMREFDNWKQGIPKDTYLDSEFRHSVDLWLMMQGFKAEDNRGPCDIEELCCAIMFNASGLLHEILKEKEEKPDRTKPVPGGY